MAARDYMLEEKQTLGRMATMSTSILQLLEIPTFDGMIAHL